jgi:predicted nucleotidyltransferase
MRNPFPENETFKKFLGLKDYFRKFTTRETVQRTRALARAARLIQSTGEKISFDLLGSVNFGMAVESSDVDVVMYLDCGHEEEARYDNTPMLRIYESLFFTTILREISNNPFRLQIVDFINLRRLERAIREPGFDDDILARFVFYRTICRGVNKLPIRKYEQAISGNKELFKRIEHNLTEALIELTRSSSHRMSFNKYVSRLKEQDIRIPPSMLEKIQEYLDLTDAR